MNGRALLEATIYADRSYIADLYESVTGTHPQTTITKNEGKKAGASLQFFSAELSATETRSYAISSLEMLERILPALDKESQIDRNALSIEGASQRGWLNGKLSVFRASTSFKKADTGEMVTTAADQFFSITDGPLKTALITNPSYFALGLDTFLRMQQTALDSMSIPVKSYVRIFAAKTHFEHWVAVPLIIFESGDKDRSSTVTPEV